MAEAASIGPPGGMPPWLSVLLRVGVTAAIAIYLVYSLTALETTDIRYIRDELDRHAVQFDRMQSQFDDFYVRQQDYLGALLAIEQRVCLNTANDGVERQACLEPAPVPPPKRGGG